MTSEGLAEAIRSAVLGAGLEFSTDRWNGEGSTTHLPSVDLSVIAFPQGDEPVYANVLFSREILSGHVAEIRRHAGPVSDVHFHSDVQDADGRSIAWLPDSNWSAISWTTLQAGGPLRFVSPYPASLIKLMVAVGVARLVDESSTSWEEELDYEGGCRPVAAWAEAMLVVSDNTATSALVHLLHRKRMIRRTSSGHEVNRLNSLFEAAGLGTLRLCDTTAAGGWRNTDGAGVGHLHMTSWDTVRLLWLLLPEDAAPRPLWSPGSAPLLSEGSKARLWRWLEDQGFHEVLSTGSLAGLTDWEPGIPALLPRRWIACDGSSTVGGRAYPADVRARNAAASVVFAHKTGTTDSYVSDAGWVRRSDGSGRNYLVCITASLGRRFSTSPVCATSWAIPKIGRAVDDYLTLELEGTQPSIPL